MPCEKSCAWHGQAGDARKAAFVGKASKSFKESLMTTVESREKTRLRPERWRRARGIMPRPPAQRPWLAEGVSRSNMVQATQASP